MSATKRSVLAADAGGECGQEETDTHAGEITFSMVHQQSLRARELLELVPQDEMPSFIELCVTAGNLSLDERAPVSTCCVLLLLEPGTKRWREHARTEVVFQSNNPRYATWLQIPLHASTESRIESLLSNYWYRLQIVQVDGAVRGGYTSFRALSARAVSQRSSSSAVASTSAERVLLDVKDRVKNLCQHKSGTRMEKSLPRLKLDNHQQQQHAQGKHSHKATAETTVMQRSAAHDRLKLSVGAFFGHLSQHGKQMPHGGASGWVRLRLGASNLRPIAKFPYWYIEVYRQAEKHEGLFDLIHRSKPVRGGECVAWPHFAVPLRWCRAEGESKPSAAPSGDWLDIRVVLCECASSGQRTEVAHVYTNLEEIIKKAKTFETAQSDRNCTGTETASFGDPSPVDAFDIQEMRERLAQLRVPDRAAHQRDQHQGQQANRGGEEDDYRLRLTKTETSDTIDGDECPFIDALLCRTFSKQERKGAARANHDVVTCSPGRSSASNAFGVASRSAGLPARMVKSRPTSAASASATPRPRPTTAGMTRQDKALQADFECLASMMNDEVCLRAPELKSAVENRIYCLQEMFQETECDDDGEGKGSVSGTPLRLLSAQAVPNAGKAAYATAQPRRQRSANQ